ncbi:MAG: hypothetical protein QOI24_3224 [Acidobacteriota bacterium]|jgi:hypothetical protein|nr:hypothetical protein [Acidobacteriota bacterium]
MALSSYAAATLALEARALQTRLATVQPFALAMPMVSAARISDEAAHAIEHYLIDGRRRLRHRINDYIQWLRTPQGRGASAAHAQHRFAILKLRFNVALTQFDIFADALNLRAEVGNGVWLGGLDVVADDALAVGGDDSFPRPPVITYLDRGHGAAIRRVRARLPGGGNNPVAVIRMPRERMLGSGVASSLVHEVGHQAAALLDLLPRLRAELQAEQRQSPTAQLVAWQLWERWISEIAADFWSVGKLGIAATQGLINVVSLPRAIVFRLDTEDPHPFPWIRVKLSAAAGAMLHPDPQWARMIAMWESFYPRTGLDPQRLQIIAALEATMPEFLRLLAAHRPATMKGRPFASAFELAERTPARLRRIFRESRPLVDGLQSLSPTLALAVLGQAKQDRLLTPERESRTVAQLLTRWALARSLRDTRLPRTHTPALAA